MREPLTNFWSEKKVVDCYLAASPFIDLHQSKVGQFKMQNFLLRSKITHLPWDDPRPCKFRDLTSTKWKYVSSMIFRYWSISISIQYEKYWISISISMPKKLKYQYSVWVSFLEKRGKNKQTKQNWKFELNLNLYWIDISFKI